MKQLRNGNNSSEGSAFSSTYYYSLRNKWDMNMQLENNNYLNIKYLDETENI